MRRTGFLLLILGVAGLASAQQGGTQPEAQPQPPPASLQQGAQEALPAPPPQAAVAKTNLVEKAAAPTYPDLYCAGFISAQKLPDSNYVAAGWDTPSQARFTDREYIYLTGSGYKEGGVYAVLRQLRDIDRAQAYGGQRAAIRAAGFPYAEIAHVTVIPGGIRNNTTIAEVTFGCDAIVSGDIVVPFVERPRPEFKYTGAFNQFEPPNDKLTGRIIMARDFDQYTSRGDIIYLNVGSENGVKVGDYFHATRTYSSIANNVLDSLSFKASDYEDTQADPKRFPKSNLGELPRKNLANLLVLNVMPKSSTALIAYSIEEVKVGDNVQLFEPPPPPPSPPVVPTGPSISCAASPVTVHSGESSTVTCDASSPDNHPLTFAFSASGGRVSRRDNRAVLDTAQLAPGTVTVTGTVTDDRDQSASSPSTVNVEAALPPPAPASQDIQFKPRGSYVDNKAKAILDGIALQLQQQTDATAVVVGHADKDENKMLAMRRASNVKKYLTDSKGIDTKRIETREGVVQSKTAIVWVVPAGASVPQETAPADQSAPPQS